MRSPGFRSPLAARRPSSAISNGGGGGAEKEVALTEREAAYPFVKKVMMPRKSGKQFDAAYTLADEISADDFPVAALYAGKTLKRSTTGLTAVMKEFRAFETETLGKEVREIKATVRKLEAASSPEKVWVAIKHKVERLFSPKMREIAKEEAKAATEAGLAPLERKLDVTATVAGRAHSLASEAHTNIDSLTGQAAERFSDHEARIGANTRVGVENTRDIRENTRAIATNYVDLNSRLAGLSEANLEKYGRTTARIESIHRNLAVQHETIEEQREATAEARPRGFFSNLITWS
jgi:uncharacterized protein YukE